MQDTEKEEILIKFNTLLGTVYSNKLKQFCEEFDIRNLGESFYKKVQKNRNRMSK